MAARTLGYLQYHTGRINEARATLEKARGNTEGLISAGFHLAMIEHRLGNLEKARKIFEETTTEGRKRFQEGSQNRDFFELIRAYAERTLLETRAR